MKADGYHDHVPVCNTEYEPEVFFEDNAWHWAVNGTDYDYDGEELGTGGVYDGTCATEAEAWAQADAHVLEARKHG